MQFPETIDILRVNCKFQGKLGKFYGQYHFQEEKHGPHFLSGAAAAGLRVSRDGSNAKNVLIAARNYGLEAGGYRMEPEQIRTMGKFPCIIH